MYEGDFLYGIREGKGKLELEDGSVYNGEFYEDQPHGYGVLNWANGSAYAGIFINGEIRGNKGIKIENYFEREVREPRRLEKLPILLPIYADESENYQGIPPIHSPFSIPKRNKIKPKTDLTPFEGFYGIPITNTESKDELKLPLRKGTEDLSVQIQSRQGTFDSQMSFFGNPEESKSGQINSADSLQVIRSRTMEEVRD